MVQCFACAVSAVQGVGVWREIQLRGNGQRLVMICVGTVATCTLGEQILLQQCATMCWLLCAFNDYPQSFFLR
jgi:hypothetical protein